MLYALIFLGSFLYHLGKYFDKGIVEVGLMATGSSIVLFTLTFLMTAFA